MAAEAENALNGPANAKQYLMPILNRAYPSAKVSTILNEASTKESFQLTIEDQRKFEFAGEGLRKLDLMRWGKLGSTLAQTKEKMTQLANRTGIYANYPKKLYFNEGLGAASTDADSYEVYGLEAGQTDAEASLFTKAAPTGLPIESTLTVRARMTIRALLTTITRLTSI